MQEERIYSSRLINTYIEYLRKNYPDLNINSILDYSKISKYELDDDGHWLTQDQINRFHEKMDLDTGDSQIAREVGRYSIHSGSFKTIRQYALGFISPFTAFSVLKKITYLVTRGSTYEIRRLGHSIEMIVRPKSGVHEKKFQCENRLGTLEAMANLYTGRFPKIEHSTCVHKGDDCCTYIIPIEKTSLSLWRRLQRYTTLLLIPVLLSYFFLPHITWFVSILSYFVILLMLTGYHFYLEKRELLQRLDHQSNSAERLMDEINKGYNNALLIQEVGQTISNVMEIKPLLAHIMETLEKRLDFDRGAIMLAAPKKDRLIYTVGYGYSSEFQNYLKNVEFNMDKPEIKTPFAIAFRKKEPTLVNNVHSLEKVLSPRSWEFAKIMESESFICVPIVYKGEALGILLVDNVRSKRQLGQSDMNLLMGIANQIGSSINNAISYQKIMESEERFRSLSENAPDIIFTLSENAEITYVNPAWEKLLGHTEQEILGGNLIDFLKKESAELHLTTFKKVWKDKEIITNLEGTLLKKDNSEKVFSFNYAPNTDPSGKVNGIVGISKDITEQRRLEAQLRQAQKMEAIGTLAGGIAHDFNNILTAIMGYTEMAIFSLPEESKITSYLNQVYESSTRAKDLITQILTFSRQTEQEFKPLKTSLIIKEAAKLLRASIPATIEIELNLKTSQDTVLADPTQIHQVLMNLCTNAAYAMKEGGGVLGIELGSTEHVPASAINADEIKSGPYLELVVSDTGHGMDASTMERIFDPFFTTKAPGEGTGMGLSVVHGIIKSHGGAVLVESRLHQGTKFHVYFPLILEKNVPRTERDSLTPVLGGTERILFVDDEPALVHLGKEMLERIGYEVSGSVNGLQAFNMFRSDPGRFDIIITDLTMPNMTGVELSQKVLQIKPEMRIIICTGFSESLSLEDAKNMGVHDIILKPITTRKIATAIRDALDKN